MLCIILIRLQVLEEVKVKMHKETAGKVRGWKDEVNIGQWVKA
jgi:hypothetical protein